MPKKILIIDDDIDLVETMRMVLENEGFKVFDAQDGIHGLKSIKENNPDLIILDVMMEREDEGFHVAYEIQKEDAFKDIPIVMLSAISQETGFSFDPEKDGEFIPVKAFIEKPINHDKLIEIIKTNLGF